MPCSSWMVARSCSAMAYGVPSRLVDPLTSRKASSSESTSTRGVTRRKFSLTDFDTCSRISNSGEISTASGHSRRALVIGMPGPHPRLPGGVVGRQHHPAVATPHDHRHVLQVGAVAGHHRCVEGIHVDVQDRAPERCVSGSEVSIMIRSRESESAGTGLSAHSRSRWGPRPDGGWDWPPGARNERRGGSRPGGVATAAPAGGLVRADSERGRLSAWRGSAAGWPGGGTRGVRRRRARARPGPGWRRARGRAGSRGPGRRRP